ncbi:MAG: hypothetical protein ABW061_03615 [Polyangiaceae bacterium]
MSLGVVDQALEINDDPSIVPDGSSDTSPARQSNSVPSSMRIRSTPET